MPRPLSVLLALAVAAAAEGASALPAWQVVAGQRATCAGPRRKAFAVEMVEVGVDLGQGLKTTAWTFNGTVPGPTLEACVGDTVALTVTNKGTMAHGLDTHAFRIDARKFGPIEPGRTATITAPVTTPGVFMYHCAAGEMTDQHIKMGMAGVMIVYPRSPALPPAKELVVMRNGVYGTPSEDGTIAPESKAMERNAPTFFVFNGSLAHPPIALQHGARVRVYFVNAGPGVASFHVIGTILDAVRLSGNPSNTLVGVQTVEVGAGNGASIDFTLPEAGTFLLVDHDQLAHLPEGFVIPFAAE
ncbi:MAG TPA: multicopper oxidase domain-containing protein [Candidatus Binatia bacterium]|nr:multicopper oxidase domain-containing protein [Candidatus Binatia bacterium]